jgi:hypothetical protein
MPIEYGYFYGDYFNGYRVRSAWWFDSTDFRDVAAFLIANEGQSSGPAVYLSQDLDDVAPRWRFYMAKHGREELAARTNYFTASRFDLGLVPAGSLLVFYANDPHVPVLLATGTCSIATQVIDVAGGKSAVILRKQSS